MVAWRVVKLEAAMVEKKVASTAVLRAEQMAWKKAVDLVEMRDALDLHLAATMGVAGMKMVDQMV